MNTKELELIIGILCLLISILWGIYEFKEWNRIKKNDYMLKSIKIQIIAGLIIFFIIGIVGIYRYFS